MPPGAPGDLGASPGPMARPLRTGPIALACVLRRRGTGPGLLRRATGCPRPGAPAGAELRLCSGWRAATLPSGFARLPLQMSSAAAAGSRRACLDREAAALLTGPQPGWPAPRAEVALPRHRCIRPDWARRRSSAAGRCAGTGRPRRPRSQSGFSQAGGRPVRLAPAGWPSRISTGPPRAAVHRSRPRRPARAGTAAARSPPPAQPRRRR